MLNSFFLPFPLTGLQLKFGASLRLRAPDRVGPMQDLIIRQFTQVAIMSCHKAVASWTVSY